MLNQTNSNRFLSRVKKNKSLILRTLLVLALGGCTVTRMPQLLSLSETTNAKPKITEFLDRNSLALGEDVRAAIPIQLNTFRQTNEILPYECWEFAIATKTGRSSYLLWKIYTNVEDALAEQNHILKRLAQTELPLAIPVVWDKAEPYAKAPSVLLMRPNGMSFAGCIAWKVKGNRIIDGSEYTDLIKRLLELHTLPSSDSIDGFPVGDWLRQMAEVGVTRNDWDADTRNQILDIAKAWHSTRAATIHGDLTSQNVWVDSTFSVTAMMDWEKLGTGDPAIDLGYLLADATVIQPFEMRERYGIPLPESFSATDIGKNIVHTYCNETHSELSPAVIANLRAAYTLRIIQTYLYQHNDPLLQVGMNRLHQYIPALLANNPVAEMVK